MDAIKFLKQDHDEMKGLFKRLEAAKDEDRIQELYDELEQNIIAHTQVEEELFYPAARKIQGLETLVDEAIAEHHAVDAICDEIAEIDAGDEAFKGRVKAMQDTLLHHIEEEENELFPKVQKGCSQDQLAELGQRLEERKNEILEKEPAEA